MKRSLLAGILLVIVMVSVVAALSLRNTGKSRVVNVCSAGSMSLPVKVLSENYARSHDVVVHVRMGGSLDLVRGVSELGLDCNVLVVADYRLIPEYLYPAGKADWYAIFASNEMVIAWNNNTRPPGDYEAILREVAGGKATLGISDPNRDPCGYRAIGVIGLVALHDNNTSLLDDIVVKGIPGSHYSLVNGTLKVYIPASYTPRDPLVVRPRSIELIALLQEGAVDYALLYKNEAVQHHLNYVELPGWASLSREDMDNYYSRVVVLVLAGTKDAKAIPMHSIAYGLTTIKDSGSQAVDLAQYILDSGDILAEYGFNPLNPPIINGTPPWTGQEGQR
ncbi:MAG: substrate-binding domain-containing protein [Desulfurococcales archaeon]|nr:substrate-binding domain-containing protein [Desulfurococcales archaeon]